MPFTTVVAGTVITASYGNLNIRNQVITPFASAAARTAAVGALAVEGMCSWLSDGKDFWTYTGAAYAPIAGPPIAYKTADEILNNSAALQNDDHLAIAVIENAYYTGELHIGFTSNVAAGLQVDFTAPAGSTMRVSAYHAFGVAVPFGTTNALGAVSGLVGNSTQLPYRNMFTLHTGGTAGTFQFRWAQSAAHASDTTVHQGSFLRLQRAG